MFEKLWRARSPLYRSRFLRARSHFSALFFSRSTRSILPRWGEKKRQSLFPPKKNLLARAKQFRFKVGAKIDFWPFYVQSRSQNRSVTILNLYMGGGRGTHRFPPSIHVWTPTSTDASTPVGVYAHLLNFFGNFKNSWKIYEPNKWKKCVSLLEFGAFLDFVAILAPQQQKSENQKILRTFAPLGTQLFGENCPTISEILNY